MIYFVSNNHNETFYLKESVWEIIKNFIFFFDDRESCPVFHEYVWLDIDLYDGYLLSSNRTKYMSYLIEKSLSNPEECTKEFGHLPFYKHFFDFSNFLKYSNGIQVRLLSPENTPFL